MVAPASQEPYNALLLASRSLGLLTTPGSEELNAFIPSSAISEMIGLPSCAYSASTQCAIAFMPLAAEMAAGSSRLRAPFQRGRASNPSARAWRRGARLPQEDS